jgi:hypothetical protein
MTEQNKVFVTPGAGRKVPLPLPGGGSVPAGGATVVKTLHVVRLIASGDLVEGTAPENVAPVTLRTQRGSAHVTPPAAEPVTPAAPPAPAAKGEK